jgi:hypothetical protein
LIDSISKSVDENLQNKLPDKIVYSPFGGFQYTVGKDVFTLGRDRGCFEGNKQENPIKQL